jgi:hypothetical protein
MATPTDPTAALLVTEAYNQSGIASPSSDEVTRGTTYFLEEILDDIWNSAERHGNTRLKTLQYTQHFTLTVGKNTYAIAESMDEEFSLLILDGPSRNTAQAGAATTITLAADETITNARALGKLIYVTAGTGVGGNKRITAYDSSTKIATVESAWTINPASGSTYTIVETQTLIDEEHPTEFNLYQPATPGKPSSFMKYGREIVFNRPVDRTYVFQMKAYYNIHQVDRVEGASETFTRILRNWRSVLQAGLEWKVLESQDDGRAANAEKRYERRKESLVVREIAYGGEFVGFRL